MGRAGTGAAVDGRASVSWRRAVAESASGVSATAATSPPSAGLGSEEGVRAEPGSATGGSVGERERKESDAGEAEGSGVGDTDEAETARGEDSEGALSTSLVAALDADPLLGLTHDLPAPPPRRVRAASDEEEDADALGWDPLVAPFTRALEEDEILVGLLPRGEVAEAEEEAERVRLETLEAEARERALREASFLRRERAARERVVAQEAEASAGIRRRARAEAWAAEAAEDRVRDAYRAGERHLLERVRAQGAAVGLRYGQLEQDPGRLDGVTSGSAALARVRRGIRALWERIPVPLRIRPHVLRGAKDRLPPGRYALLVTLWDRLGGSPLRWTRLDLGHGAPRLRGLARPAASRPVRHRGRFSDTEVDFGGQSMYTLVPAGPDLRPASVLVMELFRLRGSGNPVDHVVAWTALPAANADLRPASGRFRLPLMRGAVDPSLDQYSKLEDHVSASLEHWIGNLYLEVTPLPREELSADGSVVGEFDVEVEYVSRLLLLSSAARGENRAAAAARRPGPQQQQQRKQETRGNRGGGGEGGGGVGRVKTHTSRDPKGLKEPARADGWITDEEEEDALMGGVGVVSGRQDRTKVLAGLERAGPPSTQPRGDRAMAETLLGPRTPRTPRGGGSGPVVAAAAATTTTADGERRSDLSTYQYAVMRAETRGLDRGRPLRETVRKLKYLREELLADLHPGRVGTASFWLWWLVLLSALYVSIHIHPIGQWLLLSWLRVPVYEFAPTGYGVRLKYVGTVLPMEYELGVVLLGPMSVIVTFLALMGIAAGSILGVGHFPALLSRFVAFFGVAAAVDPFLVLAIDVAASNYDCSSRPGCADVTAPSCSCTEGDAFKLYSRFLREESSGVIGVFLTLFVYAVLIMLALFLLYLYLLRLHMDGRMLDVYRRLHAPERAFLVPDDLELSAEELMGILESARGWRGVHGERHRVGVCDYVLTDPLDPAFREVTSHVVIYAAALDGSRRLYRHFLRHPDGTIIELFGSTEEYLGELSGLAHILKTSAPADGEEVGADGRRLQRFFRDLD